MSDNSERYEVEFTENARHDLKKLHKDTVQRILSKLEVLAQNVSSVKHLALKGRWKKYYKLRVGDYRIIYDLQHDVLVVLVIQTGHRREVYDE